MALVDARGRVFGRVNLIDAAAIVLAGALFPLAYASYSLFRTPSPQIESFEPRRFGAADGTAVVRIRGQHLRPFLRATLGNTSAIYLLRTPNEAQIELPRVAPGIYDLVLYDEARELVRYEDAITITPPPPSPPPPAPVPKTLVTFIRLTGAFIGLRTDQAAAFYTQPSRLQQLAAGWGEILALGRPEPDTIQATGTSPLWSSMRDTYSLPALLRVRCEVQGGALLLVSARAFALDEDPDLQLTADERAILKVQVNPFWLLSVPVPRRFPGSDGPDLPHLTFRIEDVFPSETTLLVIRMRAVMHSEALGVVKASLTERTSLDLFAELKAQLLSVEVEPEFPGIRGAFEGPLMAVIASVRVPATATPNGWSYRNSELKPGTSFTLQARDFNFSGQILSVAPFRSDPPGEEGAKPR